MSLSNANSKERDFLREKERQARHNMLEVQAETQPIFGDPIKVEPSYEDEVRKRIRDTLGDYSKVKHMIATNSIHLIGVSYGHQTSGSQKIRIDGSHETTDQAKNKVMNGRHHNKNKSTWPSSQQSVERVDKEKQWHSESRKHLSKEKNKPPHKHLRHPSELNRDLPSRDLHQPSSRGNSRERPQIVSSAEKCPIPTARIKPFQVEGNNSNGGLTGSVTTTASTSPSSNKLKGMVMNGETKESKLANKYNLPKLSMLDESKIKHESQYEVENILKEMKYIAPPLTGIHTPRKEEHPKFPFPVNLKDGSGLLSFGKEKKFCDSPPELIREKVLDQSPCIQDDLALSDDSDDEQNSKTAREGTLGQRKSWAGNAPDNEDVAHSSSSDSSSSDSEDSSSSSDSDSSSSNASPPHQSPKQNWSLQSFVNKIQTTSPVAPVSSGPLDTSTCSGMVPLDKSSPRLDQSNDACSDFIFGQIPSPKLMGLTDDSNSSSDLKNDSKNVSSCEIGTNGTIKIKITKSTTESEPKTLHPTTGNKKNSTRVMTSPKWSSKKSSSEEHLDEIESSPLELSSSKIESLPNKSPVHQISKSVSKSTPKSERKPICERSNKKIVPKSKQYIESQSSDEDVYVDVVGMTSPYKLDHESQTSRSSSKHEIKNESSKFENSVKAKASLHKPKIKDRHKSDKENKSKDNKKENKNKESKNNSGISDMLKIIGGSSQEFITQQEPLLSPIPNREICQQKLPPLIYKKNGDPSLMIHIDISLIDRLPSLNSQKTHGASSSKSSQSFSAPTTIASSTVKSKEMQPPQTVKIKSDEKSTSQNLDKNRTLKRKSDNEHKLEEKKQKVVKNICKQPNIAVEQKEATSQEDDRSWDRKHPPRLPQSPVLKPSSNLNKHSSTNISNKVLKDGEKEGKKKKVLPQEVKVEDRSRSADKSGSVEPKKTSSSHPSSHKASSVQTEKHSTPQPQKRPHERQSNNTDMDEGHFKADVYLQEAKRMKHEADNESNKTAKARKYLDAVLYFILTGIAMEQDQHTDDAKAFTMFKDTLNLIKHISSKFHNQHCVSENGNKDNKLAVLSLRCQSVLYLKLFNMRRDQVTKFQKIISDYNKVSASKSSQAPSPYQTCWSKTTGTPSPMSPTPSPAGSVGSVGSQGSGNSDATGNTGLKVVGGATMSSPSTVCIPQRIYYVMQQQMANFNYLVMSHDLWVQADQLVQDSKEFFDNLTGQNRQLTLHSSLLNLVQYVRQGLTCLKDT